MRRAHASYTQTVGRIVGIVAVLVLAGCGGAASEAPSVSTPSDIVALMDTPRLISLKAKGRVIFAEGQATTAGGDVTRTEWFTTVGAVECAQRFGGWAIFRRIRTGTRLSEPEKDEVGTLAEPGTFLTEDELRAEALRSADAAGVVVEEVNYVPFFGGTAEFVLRPTDESQFMSEFDERMSRFFRFFGDLPSPGERPVLVTIVDENGANRLVQGDVPLSEDGKDVFHNGKKVKFPQTGVSWGWYADDLETEFGDAAVAPVQNAPPGP